MLWYSVFVNDKRILDTFHELFDDLNMDIARFDIYWGKLEPQKGKFDWRITDDLINGIKDDKEILLTIYSVNSWGVSHNDCREKAAGRMGKEKSVSLYNRPPSSIPQNMEDYKNFLSALVNRYKGRVKYWQIENEVYGAKPGLKSQCQHNNFWLGTPKEYVELLKAGYKKIKETDPASTVISSSIAFGPVWPIKNPYLDFFNYTIENAKEYTDIIDLHLYGCIEDIVPKIDVIKKRLQKSGYNKPFWSTETGEIDIDCHDRPEFKNSLSSPEEFKLQSEEVVKKHVVAFANNIEKVFRLRMSTYLTREAAGKKWNHMGFTYYDKELLKKPSYFTYQIMTSKLKDFTSAEKKAEGIYTFYFKGKKPVFVLWSPNNSPQPADISRYIPEKAQIRLTHIVTELDKANKPVYKKNEIIDPAKIPLTRIPVFAEIEDK